MPASTPTFDSVLSHARKEASDRNSEFIEAEHFLYATYSVPNDVKPQSILWMEKRGVQSDQVRKLLAEEMNMCNVVKTGAPLSLSSKFQKIVDVAFALSPSPLLTTEAVVCSILMHGKSKATDILEKCSNGKVKPFDLPLPDTRINDCSSTSNSETESDNEKSESEDNDVVIQKDIVPKINVGPLDPKILPRYGGFATFARLPRLEEVESFDVAILGMPYDSGCTFRPGARFGPSAIREASRILRGYHPVLDVNTFSDQQVVDAGDVCCNPFSVSEMIDSVVDSAKDIIHKGGRIMTIGGDHSVAYPLLKAHHHYYGPLALLHFDAHLDTWDTYFGETHTHGTPFRRAGEEGLFRDDVSMHVGIRGPVYDAEDFVQDEQLGFKIIRADEIEDIGIKGIVNKIKSRIGNAPLYISIDIDVLDPAFAPGTGTPEAGGFTSRELLNILRGLRGLNVIGADVVEVSPAYDHAEITSMAASTTCFELMSLMALSKVKFPLVSKA